jgi:hypothetical protein
MNIEFLTAALVLITAIYAGITFLILRANEKVVAVMREQALATSRPYVVVIPFLELDNPIFYLRIANTERTATTNLRLIIDKSFQQFGEQGEEHDLSTFIAFNQTIDSFSPGAEIIFPLAQGAKVFSQAKGQCELPRTFSITAEYDFAGQHVAEINQIDLRPYLKAGIPQDAYVRKLESIRKSLESIATQVKNTS